MAIFPGLLITDSVDFSWSRTHSRRKTTDNKITTILPNPEYLFELSES